MSKLSLVSVPIGNIKDITIRAKETLLAADVIVCEDTRQTGKLLGLLGIPSKKLVSYRDQNHEYAYKQIEGLLNQGLKLSLVSDRGTPLISDPGYKLVRDLLANGFEVDAIPGVSALVTALTLSGLPTDRFIFFGFLSKKESKLKEAVEVAISSRSTFIIYESPFRINKTISIIAKYWPELQLCIARELTKLHEEVIRASAADLVKLNRKYQGEIVLIGNNQI